MFLAGVLAWFLGVMAIPVWAGLFLFFSLVFWVSCVHYERTILSFFGMIVVLAMAVLGLGLDPLTYVMAHPLNVVGVIVGYALLGIVWGFCNWKLLMFKIKNAMYGAAEDWKAAVSSGSVRKDMTFEDYGQSLLRQRGVLGYNKSWPTKGREHIGSISYTMAYWPASLLQTLLWDLLQTLYTRVVVWMMVAFQKIAAKSDAAILDEAKKL